MIDELRNLARKMTKDERRELSIHYGRIFGAIDSLTTYELKDLTACARHPGKELGDFHKNLPNSEFLINSGAIQYIFGMLESLRVVDTVVEFTEKEFGTFLEGFLYEKNMARGPCREC